MPWFRCADAGATCKVAIVAATREDLLHKIRDHLVNVHHVAPPTRTVMRYLESKIHDDPPR